MCKKCKCEYEIQMLKYFEQIVELKNELRDKDALIGSLEKLQDKYHSRYTRAKRDVQPLEQRVKFLEDVIEQVKEKTQNWNGGLADEIRLMLDFALSEEEDK